jgi:hypothetical protein
VLKIQRFCCLLVANYTWGNPFQTPSQVGFTPDNPDQLKQAIFNLVQTYDAIADRNNKYGTYYLVEGPLLGPNGALAVVTVWIERTVDGIFQFVTLKPKR